LVVDDDPAILELVHLLLTDVGYTVTCARNGEEGLRRAEDGEYDVILTDVMMPVMRGDRMAEAIQARKPDVPIVLMTASRVQYAPFPILQKPFDLEQVEQIVRERASRRQTQ
jgi:CheY-like chemotaxis protein